VNVYKSTRRDSKINRRKNGHQVDNTSIFVIEEQKKKRAKQIQQERLEKEQSKEI
jgi:hypothetical protein